MNPPTFTLYEKYQGCPKCGYEKPGARFCDGGLSEGKAFGCAREMVFYPSLAADHLHIGCLKCSYRWLAVPPAFDLDSLRLRCDGCLRLEEDGVTGEIDQCGECSGLYCQWCSQDGCVGCSQIQEALGLFKLLALPQVHERVLDEEEEEVRAV